MEFWGIEVKAGKSIKVEPEEDQVIHISQASLGESKKGKGADSVPLYVKCGDQKLVLGTLSSEKFPQIAFDLVFEKEFELSHNWSGGSVYFMGYKSLMVADDEEHSDYDDSDEEVPLQFGANGSIEPAPAPVAAATKAKPAKKSEDSEEDDSDSEDDSEGSDDEDEVMSGDSDEDDDDSEEDDETPKKPEVSKKRPNEAATKTPDNKKAKLATPSKTDGKKEVHTATPHPKKGKTPVDKKNQSPKSGGSVSCKSCSKTFNSEAGLQSHAKAKHSGGK